MVLVRQLAASSEYGLFSANVSHLQALANSALREPDVDAVTIVDGKGYFDPEAKVREMLYTGRAFSANHMK